MERSGDKDMKICAYEKCTGCYACYNICPMKCINLLPGETGHIIPVINLHNCSGCGLCRKICPSRTEVKLNTPLKAYASWSSDPDDRKTSSSGGAASVFARHIIKKGGVAYGASSIKNGKFMHERIEKIEDVQKFKGSKYVQSSILNTFRNVKADLHAQRIVLFIGTPCQVAGLKNYLGNDHRNLYTVDFVCHGVPSMQLLNDHIITRIGHGQYDKVSFRENGSWVIRVLNNDETKYAKSIYRDLYYIGFMKGLFYRDSCYTCKYARKNRASDITIGDFWGLGKMVPVNYPLKDGVSLLLPCTCKGTELIDECKGSMFLEERPIKEALQGNSQLNAPSVRHPKTELFRAMYKTHGFRKAAKLCLRKERVRYMVLSLYLIIRRIPKKNAN
jgi:coenzyme F420-reducing hydrogenase beta subunit